MIEVVKYGESPISEELAFQHLRVGDSPHDAELIRAKIGMAIGVAEDKTNRFLRRQTIRIRGSTDINGRIRLPTGAEIVSVEGVEKWDYNPSQEFIYTLDPYQELVIVAEVGFDKETFPPAITAAVLLILGTLYENESDEIVGRSVSSLTRTADAILQPWRVIPSM